jgi:hypothetical protein
MILRYRDGAGRSCVPIAVGAIAPWTGRLSLLVRIRMLTELGRGDGRAAGPLSSNDGVRADDCGVKREGGAAGRAPGGATRFPRRERTRDRGSSDTTCVTQGGSGRVPELEVSSCVWSASLPPRKCTGMMKVVPLPGTPDQRRRSLRLVGCLGVRSGGM